MATLPRVFLYCNFALCRSYNPKVQALWFGHVQLSLATTGGISFDYFSSRYLDVSVP